MSDLQPYLSGGSTRSYEQGITRARRSMEKHRWCSPSIHPPKKTCQKKSCRRRRKKNCSSCFEISGAPVPAGFGGIMAGNEAISEVEDVEDLESIWDWKAIFLAIMFIFCFGTFSWISISLRLCFSAFSASLLLCFSASLLVCFSKISAFLLFLASLLLCFSALLLLRCSALLFSLLFCFSNLNNP